MYNGLRIMKDAGRLLRIGEVAEIIEVPIHTLHYWERMFKEELSPYRSRGGQRRYSETDIEKIREVKRLLKDEGYSINGARRVFKNGDRKREAFSTHGGKESDWSAIAQEVTRLIREKCSDR
jgi:DNA-binding transcriptional MerR regulator